MEWSDIEVMQNGDEFVAERRGDYLINGVQGCWVSICGRGPTEEAAHQSLAFAMSQLRTEAIPESGTGGE